MGQRGQSQSLRILPPIRAEHFVHMRGESQDIWRGIVVERDDRTTFRISTIEHTDPQHPLDRAFPHRGCQLFQASKLIGNLL